MKVGAQQIGILKISDIVFCVNLFAGLVSKFMNKTNDGLRAACKKCGYGKSEL